MTRSLVTGGAGFIGSNLVERLLHEGHEVRVLDNYETGNKDNLTEFLNDIELFEGDIRDAALVKRAISGADFVFHQAALSSVPRSIADPIASNAVNVDGTLNVLMAAREANVQKVVYASSSSIYGPTEVLPKEESMPPNPISPYALAKFAGEKYCQIFSDLYDLPTVCLRYFNIFGPRQDPKSEYAAVVPLFITNLLSGQPIQIYGNGEQSRDFTYIENAINANLLAATASKEADGEIFNVGCNARATLNTLVNLMGELIGIEVSPEYHPPRLGDVKHSLADVSKAQRLLNFNPKVDLKQGLEHTIDWFQKQPAYAR